MKFNFEYSETTAFVSSQFSQDRNSLLEVGTYLGGFVFTIAKNCPNIDITCVDPYPTIPHIRDRFLKGVSVNMNQNWRGLYNSIDEIPKNFKFDLVHIDGEHSEAAVIADLSQAELYFSESDKLIVIVDDIFMRHFPGVTSGALEFARNHNLSPFFFSTKKMYFCRPSAHEALLLKVSQILEGANVKFRIDQSRDNNFNDGFIQSNKVLGYSLIIIPNNFNLKKLERYLNIKKKISWIKLIKLVLPPILYKGLSRFRTT
jgi:hypothetical protein